MTDVLGFFVTFVVFLAVLSMPITMTLIVWFIFAFCAGYSGYSIFTHLFGDRGEGTYVGIICALLMFFVGLEEIVRVFNSSTAFNIFGNNLFNL